MKPSAPGSSPPDDGPIRELAALRDVQPPASLVARVMTQVAAPAAPTFWQWLRRPLRFELRISLVGALAVATGIGVASMLMFRVESRRIRALAALAAPVVAGGDTAVVTAPVLVRFAFEAPGARRVAVAGSFNDWNQDALRQEVDRDGLFVAMIPLPRGIHEYMFVVDGKWVADPMTSERRPDGFGRQNSLLRL
jgi:hypothetical protein